MRAKSFVIFWGATGAAVLFLGATWSTMGRLSSSSHRPVDPIVAAVAFLGLAVSFLVAARIIVVMGPVQRARSNDAPEATRGRSIGALRSGPWRGSVLV